MYPETRLIHRSKIDAVRVSGPALVPFALPKGYYWFTLLEGFFGQKSEYIFPIESGISWQRKAVVITEVVTSRDLKADLKSCC